MTDLDKLIAAVEAGTLPEAVFHGSSSIRGHWAYTTGLNAEQRRWVYLAYNGSLDAALRLHEALLPGWGWGANCFGAYVCEDHHPAEEPERAFYADNSTLPARAWLLAVLRALKEKGQ